MGRHFFAALLLALLPLTARALTLEEDLGRSEVRVYSQAYEIPVGRPVAEIGLAERLERLGYRRVKGKRPAAPGEYFWGNEAFWIYRRACRLRGEIQPAALVGVKLSGPKGVVQGPAALEGKSPAREMPWLEPEVIAESLAGDRAPRRPIDLDDLPELVWRPLLAIEDARFFEHGGVDYRSVARALLANILSGEVKQGGSTITQQLIKMRELTPKRTLGRKVSEAVRALAIESEYDKREILECYLNHVYYGHMDGVAIHGIGAAARAFFSKPARDLTLAEASLLAGIIQSPNRLAPDRHPKEALTRRNRVLDRMAELKWAPAAAVTTAKAQGLGLKPRTPQRAGANHFVHWLAEIAEKEAPIRVEAGRGVVFETTLDPLLQSFAEDAIADRLDALRKSSRRLAGADLSAALVALDARDGSVLAYVGGDPRAPRGGFDRARGARRQPGSTVKPLLLLEAFERCGQQGPVHAATRVLDAPLSISLPKGPWKPVNNKGDFRGTVDLHSALADSLNVPFVRLAQYCGFEAMAARLREAGLDLPRDTPPSFVLGAVETTPLSLAEAYSVFPGLGEGVAARPFLRLDRPGGANLERRRPARNRVVGAASAYLVWNLLRQAVETGTGRAGRIEGLTVAAKTGTSSSERDAWFAGVSGSVVTVVWVGLDGGQPLGLSGAEAAGPAWRDFMAKAARARFYAEPEPPRDVFEAWVDDDSGLLVREGKSGARPELFRRGVAPRRDRWWWFDEPADVIR